MYKKEEIFFKTSYHPARRRFPIFKLLVLACIILCMGICVVLMKTHDIALHRRIWSGDLVEDTPARSARSHPDIKATLHVVHLDNSGYHVALEQSNYGQIQKQQQNLNNRSRGFYSSVNSKDALEHDPSIDENVLPQSFSQSQFQMIKDTYRDGGCTNEKPVKNIVFLRTHRTGSNTISNIFYRYGDNNNLNFALPNTKSFQFYWPLRFHHSFVMKDLLGKESPDFMINIARNSRSNIKAVANEKTLTIAVTRDPTFHFDSIYDYVDMSYFMALRKVNNNTAESKNDLQTFLEDPESNVMEITNATQKFYSTFYLLKNPQLFDLGYEKEDYKTPMDIKFILQKLEEELDFVLVSEYMDESLIILQRMLCWQLSDVIHLKRRVRKQRHKVSEKTKELIRLWNYEDHLFYQHFNKTLWKLIDKQDETFWDDVKKLKNINKDIKEKCILTENEVQEIEKRSNSTTKNWKDNFEYKNILRENISSENEVLCQNLLRPEKEYLDFLKEKQRLDITEKHNLMISNKYNTNITDDKHFQYQTVLNTTFSSLKTTDNHTAEPQGDQHEIDNRVESEEQTEEIILGKS